MVEPDLQKAVHDALKHYHKPDALQRSPLGKLPTIWPLPPAATQDLLASHATAVAVRRLLDQALEELKQSLPKAEDLLHQRFRLERTIQDIAKAQHLSPAAVHLHRRNAVAALTTIIAKMATEASQTERERLYHQTKALPAKYRGQQLVGFEGYLAQMRVALRQGMTSRGLSVVTGLGGIGKTSLTCEALESWLIQEAPAIERILWTEIENEFAASMGQQSELMLERMLCKLEEQLELPIAPTPNSKLRLQAIAKKLMEYPRPFVIVIDNVETPTEGTLALTIAESLLPLAQVVITSRREIRHNQVKKRIPLLELSEEHSYDLLRLEAEYQGDAPLSDNEARQLYNQVGGHPLALKLVAGQLNYLPLTEVLSALHKNSPLADELYTHVYETSWHLLSELPRKILLGLMSLPPSGVHWKGLRVLAPMYGDAALHKAIKELRTLNLLQFSKGTDIYSLHRLTYCFLEHKIGLTK